MKCEQARKLILTSYVDGEASLKERKDVEGHIAGCSACRELLSDVRAAAAGIKGEPLQEPDEAVWYSIRERIAPGRPSLLEMVRGLLLPTRPVPVIASIAVIAVIGGSLLFSSMFQRRAVDKYVGEQVYFLDSLESGENGFSPALDLPGEELFL